MAEKSNISYRPEIDGLRAIAVILVVLFHAKLEPFTAGFIGVDIFFVISGYLITSIILADLQKGKFELLKFYERRARRILPALLFVIIITTPASMALMLPSQLEDFMQSIVAVMFFASNILFWIESDYFSTASELKPLLHTWSLAVEEQYYLLFPVFAIIIWRFMPSFLGVCVFILTLLSLVLSSWWIAYDSSANFYLLPFRAWEIMTGALLVIYREYFKTRYQDLIAMLGLAGIAASLILFDAKTPFPSIYTLLPVISTSLVLIYAQTDTYVAKLLGWEPLVKVGLISYSVYLWHQPIFSNLRLYFYNGTPHYYHPILILAPFIFGYFSWKYVELPFRQHNTVNLKFFSLGIFGMFIFLNVLFLAKVNDFISSKKFDENFINSQIYANHWVGWEDCDVSLPYVDLGGCKILNPRVKAELAIIGDSHAGHYAKGFLDLASFKDENYILFRRAGCFPVLEESIGFLSCQNNYIAEAIKWAGNNPDIHTVVLSGYANLKIFGSRLVDLKLGVTPKAVEERSMLLKRSLASTIEYLERRGKTVVVIAQSPELYTKTPALCVLHNDCEQFILPKAEFHKRNIRYLEILDELQEQFKKLKIIYPHKILCENVGCYVYRDGKMLYQSDDHLTPFGGSLVITSARQILQQEFNVTGQ